jgi:hypothetical protein
MLAMNQRMSDAAEARRLLRAPWWWWALFTHCFSSRTWRRARRARRAGVLLRQPLCSCSVLFKQPWRARPRLDAMQCDAMQASVRRSASVCGRPGWPYARLSPLLASAPWLRLHPRPAARHEWSAPTALPGAGCSAGESLGAHRAGWDMGRIG